MTDVYKPRPIGPAGYDSSGFFEAWSKLLAASVMAGFPTIVEDSPCAWGYTDTAPLEITNYDHSISDGLADQLRSGEFFCYHSALNFQGQVWFEDGLFHEQVWVFHRLRETVSADSLEELMRVVNDAYGWE